MILIKMCVRTSKYSSVKKAGVAITAKDRSFIWLLNVNFFLWNTMAWFISPTNSYTHCCKAGKYFHRVDVLKKFRAVYIQMLGTCCGYVFNLGLRKKILFNLYPKTVVLYKLQSVCNIPNFRSLVIIYQWFTKFIFI